MIYRHIPNAVWGVLGPLVVWRIGVRIYRLFAKQRFSEPRHWLRAGGLAVLAIFVAAVAYEEHKAFWMLMAGLALGVVLGLVAVRLTSLAFRGRTSLIQPNRVLGLLLSLILIGRIVWRLTNGSTDATLGWNVAEFVRNPATMLLFGLFVAHYMTYAVGVVYWVQKSPRRNTDGAHPRREDSELQDHQVRSEHQRNSCDGSPGNPATA